MVVVFPDHTHLLFLQYKIQIEHWDRSVLDINATCANLGQIYLHLLGMYALSGCDTTSYPYDAGDVTALNNMVSENNQGLATMEDVGTPHTELMNEAMPFFLHYTVRNQEHPWNLLATIYSQRR